MKPKVCIDRVLPQNTHQPFRFIDVAGVRAIAPLGKQWINGTTLRVRFMGGTPAQQLAVRNAAMEWEQSCNIKFNFNDERDAELRIAFNDDDGAWSYIGTDCRFIPLDQPTMNLGWTDGGVILHELGHALGLTHEHQNPSGGIQWNENAVIYDLQGSPNYWDESTIRRNVIRKYSDDQIRGTQFDPESIMLYSFPASWTMNGISTRENTVLSAMDKHFVSSVLYPKPVTVETATELSTTRWFRTRATIARPGEEDLFKFLVPEVGAYKINTTGKTDVVMRLYGPDLRTRLIAEDDNSGVGKNAQIIRELSPGLYWAQIRHVNHGATGDYSIKVKKV